MEILWSLLQIVVGALLGVLGTIGAQKYHKRDERQDKENDRIRDAADVYRRAFIEEISALDTDDGFADHSEQIVQSALAKHRAAVIQLKQYLSTEDAEDMESDWQMYALEVNPMNRLITCHKTDLLKHLHRLLEYADRIHKKK